MIIIKTKNKTIYFNYDLFKKSIRKILAFLLKCATVIIFGFGIFWIFKTASPAETCRLNFFQIIGRIAEITLCFGASWLVNFLRLVFE